MLKLGYLLFVSLLVFGDAARTINEYLSDADRQRINNVFLEGIKSNDLQSIYYSALNLKDIPKDIQSSVCQKLASLHKESKLNDFEKNFYLTGTHQLLKCPTAVPADVLSAIKSSLAKDTKTAHELYFNYFSNKNVGNAVDDATKTRIVANLATILKTDDSLSNLGHAFNIGADLGNKGSALSKWIEGTIAQADEVDGKLLQFEGGLSITALIKNGILKLSKALGTPAPVTEDQLIKFVQYFLSRRLVQQAKGASLLLEVLETIAADPKIAPVAIDFIGNGILQPDSPAVSVKVVDILGNPLKPAVSAVHATITSKADSSALASKHPLTPKSSDRTVFELDLKALKPSRGSYVIEIAADSHKQTLHAKVLGRVKVASLEIGVGESDSASAVQKQTVTYPNKLNVVLNADHQQKILLKTLLVDEANKPVTVHQAFVLLEDKKTQREIIFVAEQDTSKAYKFDLDVGARAVYFQHKSGIYALELIVGDASLSNSFRWHIADLELKFIEKEQPVAAERNVSRSPKPEIVHQFREAEKRPPRIVSDVFTALCAAPILVLFVLWSRIGVNVSNFPISLSALGFHLGFGAILGLFGLFWYKLNMFETLRLLIPLAIVTFFFGNRLLRLIASRKAEAK